MTSEAKKYHQTLADYFHSQNYFLESIEDQRKRAKQLPPSPRPVNTRKVVELPWQRIQSQNWDEVEKLFSDLHFLESKTESGKVFDLANDFSFAIKNIPSDISIHRILSLLNEALRRDIHFISRHPTTFFQCMWNSCWWYDCPEAAAYYDAPQYQDGKGIQLYKLVQQWHQIKSEIPGIHWIKAMTPPALPLGNSQIKVLRGHTGDNIHLAFSPDLQYLASACMDYTIIDPVLRDISARVWHLETSIEVACYCKHKYGVWCVAFSPDGKLVASGGFGDDRTVHIWDWQTGETLAILTHGTEKCVVDEISFTPCGKYIIGREKYLLIIWRLPSKSDEKFHISPLLNVFFTETFYPDIHKDEEVPPEYTLVKLSNGNLEFDLIKVDGKVRTHYSIPIETNGRRYLEIQKINEKKTFEKVEFCGVIKHRPRITQWRKLLSRTLNFIKRPFNPLMRSYEKRILNDRKVRSLEYKNDLKDCILSPDGKIMAGNPRRKDYQLILLDVGSETEIGAVTGKSSNTRFSNDRLFLATVSPDKCIYIYNFEKGFRQILKRKTSQIDNPTTLVIPDKLKSPLSNKYIATPKGMNLILSERNTGKIIHKTKSFMVSYIKKDNTEPSFDITATAFSNDETKLAFAQYSRGILIWDLLRDPLLITTEVEPIGVKLEPYDASHLPAELCFSSDDCRIAGSRFFAYSSALWDANTGRLLEFTKAYYIESKVFLSKATEYPYQLCVNQTESTIEDRGMKNIIGWLPFIGQPYSDPSGMPKWTFRNQDIELKFQLEIF